MPRIDYTKQAGPRPEVPAPHITLGDLRSAVGITLEELSKRIEDATGLTASRGTLSAIENGRRGASAELLHAIALAYGLRPEAITTTYVPRARLDPAS